MDGTIWAAGYRFVEVACRELGETIPLHIMYPSSDAERPQSIGPYQLDVAGDGAIARDSLPLVVISHGTGGSPLVYRALGQYLARHGYVVAMPVHPRNNRDNDELAGTLEILQNRPIHARCVIDHMLVDDSFSRTISHDRIAIIGHSLGGYTALALAGGRPVAYRGTWGEGDRCTIGVVRDDRIRALVLLAPATPWFRHEAALSAVTAPTLLLTAELDTSTLAWHGDIVRIGLPTTTFLEHHVATGGNHFAFLTPFPAAMCTVTFAPSQDPPGFDRRQFQEQMHAQIGDFLRRTLT